MRGGYESPRIHMSAINEALKSSGHRGAIYAEEYVKKKKKYMRVPSVYKKKLSLKCQSIGGRPKTRRECQKCKRKA